MSRRPSTGFDRYFDKQMEDPEFATAYKAAREEIDSVDVLVRALDAVRVKKGLTKAELARLAGMAPEAVRRLFTAQGSNPTLETVVKIAGALDYRLGLHARVASPDDDSR